MDCWENIGDKIQRQYSIFCKRMVHAKEKCTSIEGSKITTPAPKDEELYIWKQKKRSNSCIVKPAHVKKKGVGILLLHLK